MSWWVWVLIVIVVIALAIIFSPPMRKYRKISKM